MGKAPFPGDVLGSSTTHELVVQEEPCGLVDESFGAAFTLRTVWTARGQHPCYPPPAHTLRPLALRVHRVHNRVKVSRTEKYIPVSSVFYYNLQLTKMVHAECLPTNSAEETMFLPHCDCCFLLLFQKWCRGEVGSYDASNKGAREYEPLFLSTHVHNFPLKARSRIAGNRASSSV